jgi:hypothetical protein
LAFCSTQRIANIANIANIVSSLAIASLSFISRQFIKFSNIKIFSQVLNFVQICTRIVIDFAACGIGL